MTKYKGLFTFDEDNHRYVPIAQADGIINTMGYKSDSEPKEPLIKDEKTRKAVRAWADMQGSEWIVKETDQCCRDSLGYFFNSIKEIFGDLELDEEYTIAELCGEEE